MAAWAGAAAAWAIDLGGTGWQSSLVAIIERCLGRAVMTARVVAGDSLAMDDRLDAGGG